MGYNSKVFGFEKRLSGKISIQKTDWEVACRSYHPSWYILNNNDNFLSLNVKRWHVLIQHYIIHT